MTLGQHVAGLSEQASSPRMGTCNPASEGLVTVKEVTQGKAPRNSSPASSSEGTLRVQAVMLMWWYWNVLAGREDNS